jgi:hypothetical protein
MFAAIIYPLAWIIGSSFNPGQSLSGSSIIPKNATLAHYRELFDLGRSNYLYWYWNSLKVSILTHGIHGHPCQPDRLFVFPLQVCRPKEKLDDFSCFANGSQLCRTDSHFCPRLSDWAA